jgi:hypothetical protein
VAGYLIALIKLCVRGPSVSRNKSVRYLNGCTCRSTLLIIDWGFESIESPVVVSGLLSRCNAGTTIVVLEVITVLLSLTVNR